MGKEKIHENNLFLHPGVKTSTAWRAFFLQPIFYSVLETSGKQYLQKFQLTSRWADLPGKRSVYCAPVH